MKFEVKKLGGGEQQTASTPATATSSVSDPNTGLPSSTNHTPNHFNSQHTYPNNSNRAVIHPISNHISITEDDCDDKIDPSNSVSIQLYSDDDQKFLESRPFLTDIHRQRSNNKALHLDINNNKGKNHLLNVENEHLSDSSSHISLPATTIPNHKHNYLPEIPYLPPLTVNTADSSTEEVAKQGRLMGYKAGSQTKRLVFKDGSCNVTTGNIMQRRRKYLVDIFTTLVDMKWRYNCFMFVSGFVGSWLFFAVVYFIVVIIHKDHLHYMDSDWRPCFSHVYDFYTAFLFSLETQQTIGYGFRGMEANCPYTIGILMVQCCVGVFIQSLTAGIIFAKLSQPKRRAHTLLFSRKAVICSRDGEYCLLFRVGNMRKSHFVGTSIRAFIVQDKFTNEGECIPLWQNPLMIQAESCNDDDSVFLVWPVTIVHKINHTSPLWNVSAGKLIEDNFEIIVVLEGVVESTGMTTQVRTSYLNTEILWGHRLAPLLTYQKENGQYKIDYSQFHAVIPIQSMPQHSAQEHHRRKNGVDDDAVSKVTEMENFNFGYISPEANSGKPENWRESVVRRVKGSMRFKSNKNLKKDLPNLDRRMSASTGALRALKSRHY